jgi:hypothetical protein
MRRTLRRAVAAAGAFAQTALAGWGILSRLVVFDLNFAARRRQVAGAVVHHEIDGVDAPMVAAVNDDVRSRPVTSTTTAGPTSRPSAAAKRWTTAT